MRISAMSWGRKYGYNLASCRITREWVVRGGRVAPGGFQGNPAVFAGAPCRFMLKNKARCGSGLCEQVKIYSISRFKKVGKYVPIVGKG